MPSMAMRIKKERPAPELVTGFACCYHGGDEDPSLVAQAAAGEEDQSAPGWDQGA